MMYKNPFYYIMITFQTGLILILSIRVCVLINNKNQRNNTGLNVVLCLWVCMIACVFSGLW